MEIRSASEADARDSQRHEQRNEEDEHHKVVGTKCGQQPEQAPQHGPGKTEEKP